MLVNEAVPNRAGFSKEFLRLMINETMFKVRSGRGAGEGNKGEKLLMNYKVSR